MELTGELPEIAGTKEGKLIIIGCSRNVWEEVEKLMPMNCDVMCINDMISYYPYPMTHAYTNNERRLDTYWASRRFHYKQKQKGKPLMHTLSKWGEDYIGWPFHGNGTSAFNACKAAVLMGYDDIVLCGLPMDGSGHFWEAPWMRSPKGRRADEQYWNDISLWSEARKKIFKGKITSMSGNTRDLLGSPDGEYQVRPGI